jgi:2-keto-4-pentenoate hydratase/2-oxohepta-3-ene-1,7-dioic acid hydratase in catechol pathway
MRVVSFGEPGSERPGVVVDDRIVDLQRCDASLPGSIRDILDQERLHDARRIVESGSAPAGAHVALEGTRLGPPILWPSKIVCIGLNYADHAAEQNRPLPKAPLLFAKATTALRGTGDPILLPVNEGRVDVEAELAFVVGRRARHVGAAEAMAVVAGYMCFNDVSGRAAQYSDRQFFRGKGFDTFAPCGPYLVSADEIPDPHVLAIDSRVNDRVMQQSNTSQLVFKVPQLVEYITGSMTLLPGDIVATGTPAGVGVFRDPPIFLRDGDRVEVSIEGLGTLSNPVRSEQVEETRTQVIR